MEEPAPDPLLLQARREMLRHTLATLAYRGAKAVEGADSTFGVFRPSPSSRSSVEILAHVGDLLEWATWLARGEHRWRPEAPLPWDQEVQRFFGKLAQLDAQLTASDPLGWTAERIFQGPVADALTHVGQLNMLRRMAGAPVRGENYARATIEAGELGPVWRGERSEFD